MANQTNTTKVVTGTVRLSYANIWEPVSINGGTPKYSVSLIIPKDDARTLELIRSAISAAYQNGQHKLRGTGKTVPALEDIDLPLNDGDKSRPNDAAYANSWYINAKSDDQPKMFDEQRNPVIDRSEIYSGCYARAKVTFYCYNHTGHKGIGVSLLGIQKVADGKPLGGAICTADDFADDEGEDDFLS